MRLNKPYIGNGNSGSNIPRLKKPDLKKKNYISKANHYGIFAVLLLQKNLPNKNPARPKEKFDDLPALQGTFSEVKSSSYFDSHWAKGQRLDRFYLLLFGAPGFFFREKALAKKT